MTNALLRHPRATIGFPIGVTLLVVIITLLLPRSYTSSATFMPQAEESALSQFASFAADLGLPMPTTSSGLSPQFYESLIRARGLLHAAVETEYVFTVGEEPDSEVRRGTLVELYGMDDPDPRRRVEDAIDQLDDDLSTVADANIGTVTASVQTRWPDLSRAVADRLLELVNQFDAETRQTRAAAEKVFVSVRLESARAELLVMEDSLQTFLETNRRYQRFAGAAIRAGAPSTARGHSGAGRLFHGDRLRGSPRRGSAGHSGSDSGRSTPATGRA